MANFFAYLQSLTLPRGTDLALWWIGVLGVSAILKMTDPKDVLVPLVSGLIGFIGGRTASVTTTTTQPIPPAVTK